MDRWRSEPRAVTRDLIGELMFLWLEPKEKKYMFGLMRLSDIFPLPKNGPREKVKNGNHIGKIKTRSWFTLLGKTIFSLCDFPAMLKAEGSYILPDNVPANEFLNLEGNKLSTLKTGQFGCTNI
jgi:methionyl-tRNA synthetase